MKAVYTALEKLEKSDHPFLEGAKIRNLSFHSQSLFPLYRLSLSTRSGKQVELAAKIVKSAHMADTESEALLCLREAGLSVPQSYGYTALGSEAVLFMEFIENTGERLSLSALIGNLLTLYKKTNADFGWHRNNFIGPLSQSNRWHRDFRDFWREDRILPQFQLAHSRGVLSSQDGKDLEKALQDCTQSWKLNDQKARLIHGDLWSGNLLTGPGGQPYFIDPSPAYGHPEQDLAMLALFGSSLPASQMEEIAKQVGAGPNFIQRKAFWQIYPLLVHVNIFGSAYIAQLRQAIRESLRFS